MQAGDDDEAGRHESLVGEACANDDLPHVTVGGPMDEHSMDGGNDVR